MSLNKEMVQPYKPNCLEHYIEMAKQKHVAILVRDGKKDVFRVSALGDVEELNMAPILKVPFKEMVIDNAFRTQKQLEAMVALAKAYNISR